MFRNKRNLNQTPRFLLLILILLPFQNCSSGGFESIQTTDNISQSSLEDDVATGSYLDSTIDTSAPSVTVDEITSPNICGESYTSLSNSCVPTHELVNSYASFFDHCWHQGALSCPILESNGYIGIPNIHYGSSSTEFKFPIQYTGVSQITLHSSQVTLLGAGAVGCQKFISGDGLSARTITLTGCSGNGPLSLSIKSGSAISTKGEPLPDIPASTSVIVGNNLPENSYLKASDLEYKGQGGNIKFDLFYPPNYASIKNIPVIIWLHGGAWSGGDKKDEEATAIKIANLGFFVINANYNLSPSTSATYPQVTLPAKIYLAGPDDINDLVKYVKSAIGQFNGDPNNISIGGSSAGGHLALVQASREDNLNQFHCVISGAGPTDLISGERNSSYPVSQYLIQSVFGNNSADLIKYSPTHQFATVKAKKILLAHQVQDNLVPIDQALRFATKMKTHRPDIPITRFFLNSQNIHPVINPSPNQITHLANEAMINGVLAYIHQECR
ncbi:prolyl oligopeptidase family serine peptidase [Bdellovibrio sp.]|uniref:prolyl oligopeptidase family serine peptidase n=1 Tax=Bdellovibrio sp. TaxID=28201 RepID=UPI0039E69DF2